MVPMRCKHHLSMGVEQQWQRRPVHGNVVLLLLHLVTKHTPLGLMLQGYPKSSSFTSQKNLLMGGGVHLPSPVDLAALTIHLEHSSHGAVLAAGKPHQPLHVLVRHRCKHLAHAAADHVQEAIFVPQLCWDVVRAQAVEKACQLLICCKPVDA